VVSYSRDSGTTWTRCNLSGAFPGWCYALAVAPSQRNVVYAAGCANGAGAAYRSTDFGVTWSATGAAPADTVFGLAVHPADAGRVFAATPSGTFYTTNAGGSWSNLGGGSDLKAVKFHPWGADTMYVGGNAGVSVSHNAGGAWTAMNAGLDGRKVASLEFAAQDGLLLLAGTVGGACYVWQLNTGLAEGRRTGDGRRGTVGDVNVQPNPFVSYCRVAGHERYEFTIFDHSGRQVGTARGDKIGAGLPAGVYFLRAAQAQAQAQAIGSVRVVKTE
jgi:hypothetical protein